MTKTKTPPWDKSKKCRICKKVFTPKTPWQVYCQKECRLKQIRTKWVTVRRDLLEAKGIDPEKLRGSE